MFSYLVSHVISGKVKKADLAVVVDWLGGITTLVFLKNCIRNFRYDPDTKKDQLDLYAAMKATMADLTISTLKAIATAVFAKLLKNMFSTALEFKEDVLKKYIKSDGEYKGFYQKFWEFPQDKVQGILNRGLDSPLKDRGFCELYVFMNESKGVSADSLVAKEMHDALGYMGDVLVGEILDAGREVASEAFNVEGWVDGIARDLGRERITIKTESGDDIHTEIPWLAAVALRVNMFFSEMGMDSIQLDLKSILPEKCPYIKRDELIKLLNDVPGGKNEIEFLETPEPAAPYMHPSFSGGIIPHNVQRGGRL